MRSDRKARPEGLRTGDGRALPTRLKAAIIRELRHLELALQMIAQIEAEHDVRECAISPTAP